MVQLNPIQTKVLIAANEAVDGAIVAPARSKAAVAGLLKQGFLAATAQPGDADRFSITNAGREAIGTSSKAGAEEDSPAVPTEGDEARKAKAMSESAKGKIGMIVALLLRPEGATLESMTKATGWLPHSVRGALSGTVKKKLKLDVTSEKTPAGRTYRIVRGAQNA